MKNIIPKDQEPHPSFGGTFIRDKAGNLLQHIPPTRPHAEIIDAEPAAPVEESPAAIEPPAAAPASPAKAAARAPAKKR